MSYSLVMSISLSTMLDRMTNNVGQATTCYGTQASLFLLEGERIRP